MSAAAFGTANRAGTRHPRGAADLRLAPGAAAVWAVTLAGVFSGWVPAAIVTVVACGALLLVWCTARSARWASGVLVVLLLIGVSAFGIALRTHQLEQHPLRSVVEQGDRATVRVVLHAAPSPLQGASYGGTRAEARAVVRAELRAARIEDRWVRAGGDVLLLVPTHQWRNLIAGHRVTVEAALIPPRGGDLLVAVLPVYAPPKAVSAPPEWQRTAESLRRGLRQAAAAVLGPAATGLLSGLVVGDTSGLPQEVVHEFDTAGLSHLTAVSGANLAIVCGAVLLLLRLVRAGPVVSALGAGAGMLGFVVLAGTEPSVLRAAAMGTITLLALVLGRNRSALPALSAGVIVLLLFSPGLATSAGFALSVAATAALIVLAPGWSAALHARGVPVGMAEALAVPTAAHVATAPLVAALSGEISMVAILANLLVGPVVAPATVFGVAATVIAPLWDRGAELCVWLAAPELKWVLAVADHASAVPGATVEWPSGVSGGLALAGLAAVLLIGLRSTRVRWSLAVLLLMLGVVLVPPRIISPAWPAPGWDLVACDVGQGDSLVLATGVPGEAVVVDTGPVPGVTDACLRRLGVERIPLVVLTHLHADHIGGLSGVLDGRAVGAVALGGLREPAWAMEKVRREVRAAGASLVPLSAGHRLRWPALQLEVLAPAEALARTASEERANDLSLVLRATTRTTRILLTGDIELRSQSRLLASDRDLRADVLKVPHHGSRYTIPRFLRAVQPRLALISVGHGNDYGHPSPLIVGTLKRGGTRVLRTDRQGDIAVLTGPDGLRTVSRGDPLRPEP
ncbi:DNA internalization-related competence protein ComEC/Rec2 [Haloactinomyces albus]|uniref:Competence protein ComEC n=1 Tax=Haloactinomyces albus TaxID=1352928 RepID=A0AAE4CMG7_9ACTN|nr:DNA internalization-related competence protein ComEC/Rec2 [Haloactinomyces albus]MDR7300957.1 competence protein ComEC [Haloactinomyces albus]